MPFCPDCRSEYREGFRRCSDCGAELVRELPDKPGTSLGKLPDNIDELVALDVMEGLGWPMLGEGRPVPPAEFPGKYYDRSLPRMVERLEKLGIPALLLLEGSSFDGVRVFGVTLEAENLYIPESLVPELDALLEEVPPTVDKGRKRYWLNRNFK